MSERAHTGPGGKVLQRAEPARGAESEPAAGAGRWKIYANLLALIAVSLFVLAELLRIRSAGEKLGPGSHELGMLLGGVLGILLLPLLFVGVARVFARPYTKRSFWKAYAIGMLLCAISFASQFMSAVGELARTRQEVVAAPVAETAWRPYASAEGGYRVQMPGIPEPIPVEAGAAVKLETREMVFAATHAPVQDPTLHPLEIYATVTEHLRSKGSEVEDSAIFHAGVVGRELRMKLPNGQQMVSRLYVQQGVIYQISVGGPAFDAELANRYLDSFELLPKS